MPSALCQDIRICTLYRLPFSSDCLSYHAPINSNQHFTKTNSPSAFAEQSYVTSDIYIYIHIYKRNKKQYIAWKLCLFSNDWTSNSWALISATDQGDKCRNLSNILLSLSGFSSTKRSFLDTKRSSMDGCGAPSLRIMRRKDISDRMYFNRL